jgi:hypothetical protein
MTKNKQPIANIIRVICWGCFLFFNLWSWGIPLGSVYLPEQAGLANLIGQFFAMLLFTGFLVVAAFEFLRMCFISSTNSSATPLFILFSLLIPASYYIASVFSAHSESILALAYFSFWLCLVALFGYFTKGNLPNKSTIKFTLLFTVVGILIYGITSVLWSYIYGYIIRPTHLPITPYISFGGSVVVWAALLVIVLLMGRRGQYAQP